MKRYLVFCYSNYFPRGGMKDLVAQLDNLQEAKALILVKYEEDSYDYALGHVYDTSTDSIVFSSYDGEEEDLVDFNYEYQFSNCTLS